MNVVLRHCSKSILYTVKVWVWTVLAQTHAGLSNSISRAGERGRGEVAVFQEQGEACAKCQLENNETQKAWCGSEGSSIWQASWRADSFIKREVTGATRSSGTGVPFHFTSWGVVWKAAWGMLVSPSVLMGRTVLAVHWSCWMQDHILPQVDNGRTGLVSHPHFSAFLKAFDLC